MAFKDVIEKKPRRAYMLTNEVIVRAALEADVKVVSFYPGAPQTEIMDTFDKALAHFDHRMEVAANEKVALETVAGAAMVGQRSMTSMKSVGTNVAADALYSLAYTGVKGGCLCCIADDPFAHSSQSEQDGRWFGSTSYLPMLEPSNPEEAAAMVKASFDLSEKYETVVLLRTTTRVNHQSGIVQLGEMKRKPFEKLSWVENRRKFVTLGAIARAGKQRLLEKMKKIREEPDLAVFNRVEHFDGQKLVTGEAAANKTCKLGLITAGVGYSYALESLMKLGAEAKLLKLGVLNPLPEPLISTFLSTVDQVVVVEELSPYLENTITALAKDANPLCEIIGKRSGHFSEALEYNIPIVMAVLAQVIGQELPFDHAGHSQKMMELANDLPQRLPVFCAGCPHRATFWSVRRALRKPDQVFFANDIGCYSMLALEPMDWTDSLLCMGSSLGVAAGVHHSAKEKVIVALGDSTFFHASLPGVVNAVHNQDDMTLIILHNSVTAMTGQQTHPAHPHRAGGMPGDMLDIGAVLKGLGVGKIVHIDSYADVKANIKACKEALDHEGVSAIISHGECALYHFRNYRHSGGKLVPFFIDKDICRKAYTCIRDFMCPAISIDPADGKARIAPELCVGCGVCAQLCGWKAIKSTAVLQGGENRAYMELEDHQQLQKVLKQKAAKPEKATKTGKVTEPGKYAGPAKEVEPVTDAKPAPKGGPTKTKASTLAKEDEAAPPGGEA